MQKKRGIFVVSIDFELFWGVHDSVSIDSYKKDLLNARLAVSRLLELFKEYEIHATWAIVGLLFFNSKEECMRGLPHHKPSYVDSNLSPYHRLDSIGFNEEQDPFRYAPSLIRRVQSYPFQEIGSHTFSHYYCLEKGQSAEEFRDDLDAAMRAGEKRGVRLKSIVFPRNQVNQEYLSICRENGIHAYRGNESCWLYDSRENREKTLGIKALRVLDAYWNFTGHHAYPMEKLKSVYPYNIPASRLLRFYAKRFRAFHFLKRRRIVESLTYAASHGLIYHLWFHPFLRNLEENMVFLREILIHFRYLRGKFGMESLSMDEVAKRVEREDGE